MLAAGGAAATARDDGSSSPLEKGDVLSSDEADESPVLDRAMPGKGSL